MNYNTTSQFMDKQIMDLSNSQSAAATVSNSDFIDFMNRPPEKKEEAAPSYDFMPIRPTGESPPPDARSAILGSADENPPLRSWNSFDLKTNASPIRNYSSNDADEPETFILKRNQNPVNASLDASLISEIDRTMKKYTNTLIHAVDGVSARLSQLETRTGHIENIVNDLKVSAGNSHGSTDGKMRHIENILREVHTGVAAIKDKQEILDAQLKNSKLNVSKAEPVESPNTSSLTQLPPTLPPPNAPLQHNFPTQAQPPNQFPQNQVPLPQQESYFPPSGPTPENLSQHYQVPPPQQQPLQHQTPPQPQHSPPTPPQHQYQPPPQPQYTRPLLPQQPQPPFSTINPSPPHRPEMPPQQPPPTFPTVNPPPPHYAEETQYPPPQTYPPAIHSPPSQQYYGPPPGSYEAPSNRPGLGYSGPFGPSSGHGEPYPYTNSPTKYGSGSPIKRQQQHSSPFTGQGGGSGYPQLPTARILPQALPTTSGIGGDSGSGSGSGGSGNKVSVDDVVDKVTNMGFSREQVRAAVRKLTENGQSIDLNVVLDKLMNDGDVEAPRGWFGR